jgi:hypothetical protein
MKTNERIKTNSNLVVGFLCFIFFFRSFLQGTVVIRLLAVFVPLAFSASIVPSELES